MMGEAFDREGTRLGGATGATKAEVFNKLNAEWPRANELRIHELESHAQAVAKIIAGTDDPPADRSGVDEPPAAPVSPSDT